MSKIPKADPASTPRIGHGGDTERHRPIFTYDRWGKKVEVVPLGGGAAGEGRALSGGDPHSNRVTFEVRAEFDGPALPGFDASRQQKVRRIETWNTRDQQLAIAVAKRAVELLRAGHPIDGDAAGVYDIYLPAISRELGGHD